jgi:uncharacterized repeat protein (TIGR04138 family)
MSDEPHAVFRLLKRDPRYKLEAYQFVREALSYGQNMLGLGEVRASEDEPAGDAPAAETSEAEPAGSEDWEPPAERHLTGQELCEAIREYAVDQYGLMAKVVLNSWGLHATSDFGEIVYNLINIEMMKKSKTDRREDFDNVYDFDEAFTRQFQITKPD